jgi:hypothetical protein
LIDYACLYCAVLAAANCSTGVGVGVGAAPAAAPGAMQLCLPVYLLNLRHLRHFYP